MREGGFFFVSAFLVAAGLAAGGRRARCGGRERGRALDPGAPAGAAGSARVGAARGGGGRFRGRWEAKHQPKGGCVGEGFVNGLAAVRRAARRCARERCPRSQVRACRAVNLIFSATGVSSQREWYTARSCCGGACVNTRRKAASADAAASIGITRAAYSDRPTTPRRTPSGPVAASAKAAERRVEARCGAAMSPIMPPRREKGAAPPARSQKEGFTWSGLELEAEFEAPRLEFEAPPVAARGGANVFPPSRAAPPAPPPRNSPVARTVVSRAGMLS